MSRFPKVGDFVRFKVQYHIGYDIVHTTSLTFNPGDLYEVLDIRFHTRNAPTTIYSINKANVIPFSVVIAVNDKLGKHMAIELTYESIDTGIVEFIPGDNPEAVKVLYGR